MREPLSLSRRSAVVGWWLSCVVGALLLATRFVPAYPLLPDAWTTMRADAEILGVESLRELGGVSDQPRFVTRLEVDGVLESRLLREGLGDLDGRGSGARSDRLARRILSWSVTVLSDDAAAGDWTHRSRLSLTGQVWELERRIGDVSGGEIFPGEARLEASQFLNDQGFRLSSFEIPVVMRQVLADRTDF